MKQPHKTPGSIRLLTILAPFLCALPTGCGDLFAPPPAEFPFSVPLEIEGRSVGSAIIDTGGGYEVLLKEDYGLEILEETEVVAFGGKETVSVTAPFIYSVGGFVASSAGAIVGISTCDCNGLGFHFFRRTGIILALDFSTKTVDFRLAAPPGGMVIPFVEPPAHLPNFASAFLEVELKVGDLKKTVTALLDTGANITVMRKGLVGEPPAIANVQQVSITHDRLGGVAAIVGLYETEGLPDLIIGTDVMGVWADQWYFDFTSGTGYTSVFFDGDLPDITSATANITLE